MTLFRHEILFRLFRRVNSLGMYSHVCIYFRACLDGQASAFIVKYNKNTSSEMNFPSFGLKTMNITLNEDTETVSQSFNQVWAKYTDNMWFPCKHEITTTSWAGRPHCECVTCSTAPKPRLRRGLDPISQAEAGPGGTVWKLN